MKLPVGRISGSMLRALVFGTRSGPLKLALAGVVRQELGIDTVRRLGREARGFLPYDLTPRRARESHARPSEGLPVARSKAWPRTALDLTDAYRSGKVTPEAVAERSLDAARRLANQSVHYDVYTARAGESALVEARASGARWAAGAPLSELDGVPIAVKEEMDAAGFATRLGTSFMPHVPAARDAALVAALRRAGAVAVGQTPMTEYGLSPLGVNAHRNMPRNAHDPGRLAGGSSTGSAVAVALGLVPLALGADGGGSIRVPAAYNGIYGIKPTYGRISCTGHGSPGGTSVVHFGPIAASTRELALTVELAAGPDPADRATLPQPPLAPGELTEALGRGVVGLRLGVPEAEWADADADVARAGREALAALERAGAVLIPCELPLARHAPAIGYLTIAIEARAALRAVENEHWNELGLDLRIFLAGIDAFVSDDYVDAQRLREKLREELTSVLREVDAIALPTSKSVAPAVTDAEAQSGIIDTRALDGACRFSFLGNLTGAPAGTAPVGRSTGGLPIGLQILGDAWDEACVLQVLAALERDGVAEVARPKHAVDLLG
jgi:aspartyl-tRNA(Asn)/glutamyl-tRNA(Gln) amidotransferase subunit A